MQTFFTIVTAISTVVIAIFSFLVWKTYERIAHYTGAMESHSDLMLRLKAEELKIPVFRWDKFYGPLPSKAKHLEDASVKKIYVVVPKSRKADPDDAPATASPSTGELPDRSSATGI